MDFLGGIALMKNLKLAVGATMMALTGALLVPAATSAQVVVPTPVHGAVVPETPERNWPQILNGSIEGGDQVGNVIVLGGSFTQIKLPDGSVINQPHAVAFDIDTGALVPGFRPVLNKPVSVVEAGDTPGTVFLGGKFSSVNGAAYKRLVKLDLNTGQIVTSFKSNPTGEVKTIARNGDRLFIGGTFAKVRGQVRDNLAEVSATSGVPNPSFTIGVTGSRSSGYRADGYYTNMRGAKVRAVRVTPDGNNLMIMHRGDQVGGQTRWGAAKINISAATPVVTGWRTDLWDLARNNGRRDFVGIVEGDISPDGSMIAMTTIIGNFPPLHDTTIALPTGGNSVVQPLWVTQNFDSNYGLAISDQAVYIGGHFCYTESMQSIASPMYWPGNSGNQYSCARTTNGGVFAPQTTYRYHLAALDTATGRALPWDPKSNNSRNGVNFLRTIPRGLLLGHDGTRVNNFNVGRAAFFDLQ